MDWQKIRYFKQSENWGDIEKINPILIVKLDNFREYIKSRVIISCGTGGKHVEGSQHYLGNAVDIICPDSGLHLLDQYLIAEKCGFTGIGVYPDWTYRDFKCGGLHLDVRPTEMIIEAPSWNSGPRWIGQKNNEGVTEYLPLTYNNLKGTLKI